MRTIRAAALAVLTMLTVGTLTACGSASSNLCKRAAAQHEMGELALAGITYAEAEREKPKGCGKEGLEAVARDQAAVAIAVARAQAAERAHDTDDAIAQYARALRLDFREGTALYGLRRLVRTTTDVSERWQVAMALAANGYTQEAREEVARTLKENPKEPVPQALAALAPAPATPSPTATAGAGTKAGATRTPSGSGSSAEEPAGAGSPGASPGAGSSPQAELDQRAAQQLDVPLDLDPDDGPGFLTMIFWAFMVVVGVAFIVVVVLSRGGNDHVIPRAFAGAAELADRFATRQAAGGRRGVAVTVPAGGPAGGEPVGGRLLGRPDGDDPPPANPAGGPPQGPPDEPPEGWDGGPPGGPSGGPSGGSPGGGGPGPRPAPAPSGPAPSEPAPSGPAPSGPAPSEPAPSPPDPQPPPQAAPPPQGPQAHHGVVITPSAPAAPPGTPGAIPDQRPHPVQHAPVVAQATRLPDALPPETAAVASGALLGAHLGDAEAASYGPAPVVHADDPVDLAVAGLARPAHPSRWKLRGIRKRRKAQIPAPQAPQPPRAGHRPGPVALPHQPSHNEQLIGRVIQLERRHQAQQNALARISSRKDAEVTSVLITSAHTPWNALRRGGGPDLTVVDTRVYWSGKGRENYTPGSIVVRQATARVGQEQREELLELATPAPLDDVTWHVERLTELIEGLVRPPGDGKWTRWWESPSQVRFEAVTAGQGSLTDQWRALVLGQSVPAAQSPIALAPLLPLAGSQDVRLRTTFRLRDLAAGLGLDPGSLLPVGRQVYAITAVVAAAPQGGSGEPPAVLAAVERSVSGDVLSQAISREVLDTLGEDLGVVGTQVLDLLASAGSGATRRQRLREHLDGARHELAAAAEAPH